MSKNIHFIAVGGSAMHNLALAMHDQGYNITGSDDEIYEPSRSRLKKEGLLPDKFGWFPDHITQQIDAVILGMHAKPDNPELHKAKKLNIPIYSYPEYIAMFSTKKQRIVIAGSHGKTTTTAMVMHALSNLKIDYDYLVGAQLEGFDRMVRLTDAPIIILEGDEYLSSPIDRRPKMMHYKPDLAVITGIAWDHINVFPTFDNYLDQFRQFILEMKSGTKLFYNEYDENLCKLIEENKHRCNATPYTKIETSKNTIKVDNSQYQLSVIGEHNMQNMDAAKNICGDLGISNHTFFKHIQDFKGAAKRLQLRGKRGEFNVYQDFAHAPSKVQTTCNAVKKWFGKDKLYAFFELHTYSSLNKEFLPQYKNALKAADKAFVVYDEHTLKMKNMPDLDADFVKKQFSHKNLTIVKDNSLVLETVLQLEKDANILMMSSGTFGGLDWNLITD